MLKNNLKIAIRNFGKRKLITLITILGLSIGISAALVIYQIVRYDYSFDKFEPGRDRIYRIVSEGPGMHNPGVPAPLYEAIQNEVSGVHTTAPFFEYWDAEVDIPQRNNASPRSFNKQKDIVFADSNYFNIFPHRWLAGSAAGSLKSPYELVLTESRAKLYFPGLSMKQIIGKSVVFNDSVNTMVSGVVKDLSAATDFDNKAFISLSTIVHSDLKRSFNWGQWGSINVTSQLFIKLTPDIPPRQVQKQIASISQIHSRQEGVASKITHPLQPLSDIHFDTDFHGPASKSTLGNLMLLAVFLLLMGVINFINLSTAQALIRAKEIGIRKTLGSTKVQLMTQFLTETFLLTFLATVLSILIMPLLLRVFSGYIPGDFQYTGTGWMDVFVFLCLLVITVTLLSGFYPSLVLTRFNPLRVMHNQISFNPGINRKTRIREVLIIIQFVIAQILIISVLLVNKQVHYAMNKDMGFKKSAVINFDIPFDLSTLHPDQKEFVLLRKLRALPGISDLSLSNLPPVYNDRISTELSYKAGGSEMKIQANVRVGDSAYLRLYHIGLLAGRNVLTTDSATELVINEMLSRRLGFQHPDDALGVFLEYHGRQLPVVGVMADFNEASLRSAIQPMIYYSDRHHGYVMNVALQPGIHSWQNTIAAMQRAWKAVYPDKVFDYHFLDKTIENFYRRDIRLSKLLAWSTVIAIFIACLGLLGLVIFTTNQRTKEIGIRKVLGASVVQLISLLSKDFIRLVMVAFVIAVPVAWIAMHRWLQHFAYHTAFSLWIFMVSGVATLLMGLVILSIRAGTVAMANPVNSLGES